MAQLDLKLDTTQSFPRVELLDIKLLTLLKNNPRKISKDQMEKLCESLKNDADYLYNRPCLVHEADGKYEVYAGNQRVRAAQKLKWKQIPCIVERGLSPELLKERVIRDNKTYGEFDFDILANEFDFDTLLASGFTAEELVGYDHDINDIADQDISLPDGEKEFVQMTFTLTEDQASTVKGCLQVSKDIAPFVETKNENSNGNALARICELWSANNG